MDNLAVFLRQVRNRSLEHQRAMGLLSQNNLVSQMIAVLRQELDSMVRVIYLLNQVPERREFLIVASVRGEKWTSGTSRAKMIDSHDC